MLLQAPIKKSKYYYCKLHDNNNRLFSLKIPYCTLQQVWLLSKQQGYLLHIRVPKDDFAKETIQELEQFCLQEIIKNNKKWFHNGLDESKIQELFDSCISQDTLIVYVSSLRSYLAGEDTPICNWIENNKQLPKNIQCTIVCDGLFIYPKKFGLRWIVREMSEYKEPEDILPEVQDIVDFWNEKTQKCILQIDEKIDFFEGKIKSLQSQKDKILQQVEKLKLLEIYQLEEEVNLLKKQIEEVGDEKTFL